MGEVFDCREIAKRYFHWVELERDKLAKKPCLATVLYKPHQDPGSLRYRELIHKDAAKLGIATVDREATSEEHLVTLLEKLNSDRKVTGIVVLYPLGTSMEEKDVMDIVSPRKDIEGLHSINLGYLLKYKRYLHEARRIKCVVPATAKAVIKALQFYPDIQLEGAFSVIVNNSMRVGKPLGLMLENVGSTVVKCYDKTRRSTLEESIRRADILVTAVPDPAFKIDPSWIKPGAVVVDVSFQGNIDTDAILDKVQFLTHPDNRIGKVTRAMMFINLIYCAQNTLVPVG